MTTLQEAITDAQRVKTANNKEFATIWKTGKSFGFNFEKREVGYRSSEFGVNRTVIAVI